MPSHRSLFVSALALVALSGCAHPADDQAANASAAESTGLSREEALARLAGPFDGEWTIFGVDANGATKTVTHWTDHATTAAPVTSGDRVTVEATDTMTFDGMPHPITKTWTEGYFLTADGSIGDRFVDQNGAVTLEKEIAPNTFTMVETATAADLAQLGFTRAVSGTHVTVKVVTTDGQTDVERISRVTTVQSKDESGADKFVQMVTMQGAHRHARSTR